MSKLRKQLDTNFQLIISVIIFGLFYTLLPSKILLSTRIIIAWNAGVIYFLAIVWAKMNSATPEKTCHNAQYQDESRWIIFTFFIGAAFVSLLAIAVMLKNSKTLPNWEFTLHIAFSLSTMVLSWLLIHTLFAIHYAHLYYFNCQKNNNLVNNKGLDFPSENEPDYWDFLYFSFVIGMTCQVADVAITSRSVRRLALVHGVLTFFFNSAIFALGINILAGLI